MKKSIFMALAAMAMPFSAIQAENLTLWPSVDEQDNWTFVDYSSMKSEIELTNYDETEGLESWTIKDFLGSGKSLTFKFTPYSGGLAAYKALTIVDVDDNADDGVEYLRSNGEGFTLNLTNSNNEKVTFTDVLYYPGVDYSYVYHNIDSDAAADGYRYYADILLCGTSGEKELYVDVVFYFDEVKKGESHEVKLRPKFQVNKAGSWLYPEEMTDEITKYEAADGTWFWTFTNFLGSGRPFSFEAVEDSSEPVKLKMTTSDYKKVGSSSNRYLIPEEYPISFVVDGKTYEPRNIRFSQGVTSSYYQEYSDLDRVHLRDLGDYGYSGRIRLMGYVDSPEDGAEASTAESNIYVEFNYGKCKSEPVSTEPVTVTLQDYDYANYAKPHESEIEEYEDNFYRIKDFMGSGKALSFMFSEPEAEDQSELEIYEYDADKYLTYNGSNLKFNLKNTEDDSDVVLTYPYFEPGAQYTSVYKYSDEDARKYGYKYYGTICLKAYTAASAWTDWLYAGFDFGKVAAEDSGVAELDASNDAPVEYYDLQGVRVENPSNGIFIRKQGADVKKVVIK